MKRTFATPRSRRSGGRPSPTSRASRPAAAIPISSRCARSAPRPMAPRPWPWTSASAVSLPIGRGAHGRGAGCRPRTPCKPRLPGAGRRIRADAGDRLARPAHPSARRRGGLCRPGAPLRRPAAGRPDGGLRQRLLVRVDNAEGKLWEGPCELSPAGTLHGRFRIPPAARMGPCWFHVDGVRAEPDLPLVVEEFRISTYQVGLSMARQVYTGGERIEGRVTVDYFTGKPAANADVEVVLETASPDAPTAAGAAGPDGVFRFSLPAPSLSRNETFVLRATATDVSGQSYTKCDYVTCRADAFEVRGTPRSGRSRRALPCRSRLRLPPGPANRWPARPSSPGVSAKRPPRIGRERPGFPGRWRRLQKGRRDRHCRRQGGPAILRGLVRARSRPAATRPRTTAVPPTARTSR